MPRVEYSASKGLIQKTGSGFPAADFAMLSVANLAATAVEVTSAEARADATSSTLLI